VHEPAAPAALEQDVDHGAPGARDAPALLGHDRAQQALGERAVARRQDVAQVEEQARLGGVHDRERDVGAALSGPADGGLRSCAPGALRARD
jgi:hypothetical protein